MKHARLKGASAAALPILLASLLIALPVRAGTPSGAVPLPPMHRGPFVQQLLQALHVPLLRSLPPAFSDVSPSSPDYLAINTAASDGLVQGISPYAFGPDRPISALAAATMAIKAYSPVASAWAQERGYLPVAVQLGLLPASFLGTPYDPLDLLEGQRMVAQTAALLAASGPGGWQWLAAPGHGAARASDIMDVLVAAVRGQPLTAVGAKIAPGTFRTVHRSYQRIRGTFAAFAALAPNVDWRIVGGGLWAVKPLGAGRYSADAALVLETVDPATQLPYIAKSSAWLGWPASPYFRFDFGEVDVTNRGVVGLNNLKGEFALPPVPGLLPGVVQSGVQAYPSWSVMALGVATTYPTITAPAPTAVGPTTSFVPTRSRF